MESLHFQPREQRHVLLRHAQFEQHDAVHTFAQVLGDRRPGVGSRLAGWPEVQLQVFDFMVVLGGFGEEGALDDVVLISRGLRVSAFVTSRVEVSFLVCGWT